jgi:hypothetical protein
MEFDFKCRLHNFANDKIRIMFGIENKPGAAKGVFYNTNPGPAKEAGGIVSIEPEKLTKMSFKISNTFRQYFFTEFSDELNGLSTFQYVFFTLDWKNETMYNNWNFTNSLPWDSPVPETKSFWYKQENKFLYQTEKFKIGSEQPGFIKLDLQPIRYIY